MKSLLQINAIEKHFGGRTLLEDVSVAFTQENKVGVIGRNGAGKTTLFRIITGEEEPDRGTVTRAPELRLSYMEQHDPFSLDERVIEFLMRYSGKEDWECGKIAAAFDLKNERLTTTIGDLSNGFRMRVKLTAMLMNEPNFLLLDEPSNYLDLNTLLHLERFLTNFNGGFLLISHDREFLKRTCSETLEVEGGDAILFPGGIEDYLEFKEERTEQAKRYNKNVEAKQKQLRQFIDRFKAKNTKATQAKSKEKQLNKLSTVEVEHPIRGVRIHLPEVAVKKGFALVVKALVVGYPEKRVADNITFDIETGAHIAVVGDNGEGKTTFLRTVAGEIKKLGGEYTWGHNTEIACFAKDVYNTLYPEETVATYLRKVAAPEVNEQEILNLAGSFLFQGNDVEKRVAILSGGERARLCLAGLLLRKHNILILDEPTNHLDFETVEALARALREFRGTLLFTSHDRTFVSLVAEGVIEVRGGSVTYYTEAYATYLDRVAQRIDEEERDDTDDRCCEPKKEQAKASYEARKELRSKINKIEKRAKTKERELAQYEREHEEILAYFEAHPTEYSPEKSTRLSEVKTCIAETEEAWLALQEEIETLSQEYTEL